MTTPLFSDGCGDCSASYDVTGVLDEDNLSVEIVLPVDVSTLAVQIAGTWAATLFFEGTINGVDWFAMDMQPLPAGVLASSAAANGVWQANIAGYSRFRVRAASITGEADISLRATSGPATLPLPVSSTTSSALTWSRAQFILTGADDDLILLADANRRALILYNRASNDLVRYDIAGQSIDAGADEGIPLAAGGSPHAYSGQDTPTGTVTATGTPGNVITIYTGVIE